eukprot:m.46611 g.46611  ORF g.46611 m.46611 type:complete len:221 (-) comp10390_c0_seq1:714-1376(-)
MDPQKPLSPALLIRKIGLKLELPSWTIGSALVYYHRFNLSPAADSVDDSLLSISCVYLATKAEETLRSLRDVITCGYSCLYPRANVLPVDAFYQELRESVIRAEQILLRALAFDVTVTHSQKYLLHFVTLIDQQSKDPETRSNLRAVADLGWTLITDSLLSQRLSDIEPEYLAITSLWLASETLQIEVGVRDATRHLCPELKEAVVTKIAKQLVDIYESV